MATIRLPSGSEILDTVCVEDEQDCCDFGWQCVDSYTLPQTLYLTIQLPAEQVAAGLNLIHNDGGEFWTRTFASQFVPYVGGLGTWFFYAHDGFIHSASPFRNYLSVQLRLAECTGSPSEHDRPAYFQLVSVETGFSYCGDTPFIFNWGVGNPSPLIRLDDCSMSPLALRFQGEFTGHVTGSSPTLWYEDGGIYITE